MSEMNYRDGEGLGFEEIKRLKNEGFYFDSRRDFTTVVPDEEKDSGDNLYKLNFVGFTINPKGEVITVFPKFFNYQNTETDRKNTFRSIFKHIQKNPDMYIGSAFENNISTNYPFSAFFSVYDYFERYGIHFEEKQHIKPAGEGKINWKETIRRSQKYIIDDKLIFLPFYHTEKTRRDTFIANCMIFAIDYTIDAFHFLIEKEKTNRPFPDFDFTGHIDFVLETLQSIKNTTFSDIHIRLINDLIDFFSVFKSSGQYYLKHYSYAIVWENMVMDFLNSHFLQFENEKMVLSGSKIPGRKKFDKPVFYPNLANNQHIQPDYYLEDGDVQVIMDAKYYEPTQLDFKQISYLLFLKNRRTVLNDPPIFLKTYSALIIPSDKRNSKEHFKMNPYCNKEYEDFMITEERLNIKDVLEFWINN